MECSDSFFFSPQLSWYVWICGFGFVALSVAQHLSPVAEIKSWAGGVHCVLALGSCRQVAVSNTANALLLGVFSEVKCCRFLGKI